MAISRPVAAQIRKLLDAAREPGYMVDGDGTLVFVNTSLADWLGLAADELVGQPCSSHTELATPSAPAIAARLCPPPSVFAGERVTTTIDLPRDDATVVTRQIEFIPFLGEAGEAALVIARMLAEPATIEPPGGNDLAVEPTPPEWHLALDRHRRRIGERFRSEQLLGDSLAARRMRAQVEMAAAGTGHVLVVGPSGSGRQHLARVIHQAAQAITSGMLLPLACPLLALDVLTSSLHAVTRPAASGEAPATLLLLEVDQLSVDVQTALVAALGDGSPGFRILATARTSLETLAARGAYHRELAGLMTTLMIELPPLAERSDDVPLLAQAALEHVNRESAKQLVGFTPEALDRLTTYAWPGNMDELLDTIGMAHATAAGPLITLADLPQRLEFAAQAVARPRKLDERIVLPEFLAQIERELIERALRRTKGNKAKAARLLGMTRPRLYRRMVQLKLIEGE
ncbi:MAG: sigma 54-interacting transcriptional regulator [Planctomycetaceae bacterium]|nr:sigma 54-interacting transcriptional regulator [Planctomycetaceae bacterium]